VNKRSLEISDRSIIIYMNELNRIDQLVDRECEIILQYEPADDAEARLLEIFRFFLLDENSHLCQSQHRDPGKAGDDRVAA